jgi:hypothetical protein
MAPVTLHRCSWTFLHTDMDKCWQVQRALVDQGVEFEISKHGYGRRHRDAVEQLSGQKLLPVIEFADGTPYRDETDGMVKRIRAGSLFSAAA